MGLLSIVRWIRKFLREKFHSKNEDLPYYITLIIAFIIFASGLFAFVQLTDELRENELGNFDEAVTNFVISFRTDQLTAFLSFVTHLGDRDAYIVLITGLLLYLVFRRKHWKFILQTVVVLLLATLSNIMLKKYINRARPSLEHLVTVDTLSYPSGHSMSAMAFYGFLIYLCLRLKILPLLRVLFVIILCVIIFSIGLSRIYLGVHYPSDVTAGFIGGLIWVAFCAIVFNVIDMFLKRRKLKNTKSVAE